MARRRRAGTQSSCRKSLASRAKQDGERLVGHEKEEGCGGEEPRGGAGRTEHEARHQREAQLGVRAVLAGKKVLAHGPFDDTGPGESRNRARQRGGAGGRPRHATQGTR